MESDYFHLLLYKYITPSEYMYYIVRYFYQVLFCVVYLLCFYKQLFKFLRQKKKTNKNVLNKRRRIEKRKPV